MRPSTFRPRRNRSKMRGRSAAGMLLAESRTRTIAHRARPLRGRPDPIMPPRGLYLTALLTRSSTTQPHAVPQADQLRQISRQVHDVAFGGCWCSDTARRASATMSVESRRNSSGRPLRVDPRRPACRASRPSVRAVFDLFQGVDQRRASGVCAARRRRRWDMPLMNGAATSSRARRSP
jgi:hypothetical protein